MISWTVAPTQHVVWLLFIVRMRTLRATPPLFEALDLMQKVISDIGLPAHYQSKLLGLVERLYWRNGKPLNDALIAFDQRTENLMSVSSMHAIVAVAKEIVVEFKLDEQDSNALMNYGYNKTRAILGIDLSKDAQQVKHAAWTVYAQIQAYQLTGMDITQKDAEALAKSMVSAVGLDEFLNNLVVERVLEYLTSQDDHDDN